MSGATRTPTPARRRPSAAVLALAAATAALASGCGGGSSPVSTASRASVPTAPATTPATAPATAPATTPATTPGTAPTTTPATAPAATPPASRSATPTTPTRAAIPVPVRIAACASSALRATVGGPSDAAAGSSSFYLYLTNTGRTACTLSGHPGLSYVTGADGQQVGRPATREGTPRPVTLAPGGTAHARIRATNPGDYDEAQCQPVPVTGYRVYPPDQTAALFVREAGTACSAGATSLLLVGPVVAGRPAQPGAV